MLTSKQRAILRKEAQALPVVFQVGKGEIDQALVKSTAECLAARELIKMKVLETSMYTPREAADALEAGVSYDAVCVCIERAVDALLTLTGRRATQEVVDQVFSRFCVGK